jgi:hypothetical protein
MYPYKGLENLLTNYWLRADLSTNTFFFQIDLLPIFPSISKVIRSRSHLCAALTSLSEYGLTYVLYDKHPQL